MDPPISHPTYRGHRQPSKTPSDAAVSVFTVSDHGTDLPSAATLPVASSLLRSPAVEHSSRTASSYPSTLPFSTPSSKVLPSLLLDCLPASTASSPAAAPPSVSPPTSTKSLPATSFNEVFSCFPAAVLFQLASFLSPVDINNLLATCTWWRSLCTVGLQPLWREFVNRTFGRKYENYVAFTGDTDWRGLYIKIARFISNLKRGKAEQRRFPRLLLPPVSNTYEGSLAMTTDCTRLLWENGKVLQCLDVNVGKELWRVDLAKYRNRGLNSTQSKTSNVPHEQEANITTSSRSSSSATCRGTCYTRASSVVIGRSKVFLHLEHQVYVYRLSDGTFVTTLCAPSEEGDSSAAIVGNNMPLDVSLRNDHFTFLTRKALFVFHSETLELLYKIQHRELTPAIDTCEDIDFCWAGNRCCGSVKCFGYAAEKVLLGSSSSEEHPARGARGVPSEAARSASVSAGVPFQFCSSTGSADKCMAHSHLQPSAHCTQITHLWEASRLAPANDFYFDNGKRFCEEHVRVQGNFDISRAGHTDITSKNSPSSASSPLFSSWCRSSLVESLAACTLRCQQGAGDLHRLGSSSGSRAHLSQSFPLERSVRAHRRIDPLIPPEYKMCGEKNYGASEGGRHQQSVISSQGSVTSAGGAKCMLRHDVSLHPSKSGRCAVDNTRCSRPLADSLTQFQVTALSRPGHNHLSAQTPAGSQGCCNRDINPERRGGECVGCGAEKLSFRSRCQQSCRHIVTWLVKRSKTIMLWDIRDGTNICTLRAHDAPIQKVRHVMNWKDITEYFLASLDVAGVVKIWGSGARGFCCLQELRPEQNNCVFRMSFSPTHLATMSKESAGSEVVVTVWRFDQDKAASVVQRLQGQRTESQIHSQRPVTSKDTSSSHKLVGNRCTRKTIQSIEIKEKASELGNAHHSHIDLTFCDAHFLGKPAQAGDSAYQNGVIAHESLPVASLTPAIEDAEHSGAGGYTTPAVIAEYREQEEIPQKVKALCPGSPPLRHLYAAQTVYRSTAARDAVQISPRRAFDRPTGPSLLHPSGQCLCNQVAVDPEDPSPHVKQAYLLDTQCVATLGEETEISPSSGSPGGTCRSSTNSDRKSRWATGIRSETTDFGTSIVGADSGNRLTASSTYCDNSPPCCRAQRNKNSATDMCTKISCQRVSQRCGRSTRTQGRRTKAIRPKAVSPDLPVSFEIYSDFSARVRNASALTKTGDTDDMYQNTPSPSKKPLAAHTRSEPERTVGVMRANSRYPRDDAELGIQQPGSRDEPVMNCESSVPKEDVLAVLERQASFSAGVTAYYADFIDGQLLALWHFTVSPASREHSAFQYSLSDWKIYDCLHKAPGGRRTVPGKCDQEKDSLPTEQQRWLRRAAAAAYGSEQLVSSQTANVRATDTTEEHSVAGQRAEEAFRTPVFSMRNRGDVWTLLDWKCLSFEPQGDVTVLDFCPVSAQRVHMRGEKT